MYLNAKFQELLSWKVLQWHPVVQNVHWMFYCSTIKCSTECIKILGVYISYTKKNFWDIIKNICKVTKLWHIRQLSLKISKIVYLALLTLFPNNVTEELKKCTKLFLWGNKRTKIEHDTLCNDFNDGVYKFL